MGVVLDTNVVVNAAIVALGAPARIRQALRVGAFELVVSGALLDEYRAALTYPRTARRHGLTPTEVDAEIDELSEIAILVEAPEPLPSTTTRDVDDTKILDCARSGAAAFIVTGDKDVVVLGSYEGIRILTPPHSWC